MAKKTVTRPDNDAKKARTEARKAARRERQTAAHEANTLMRQTVGLATPWEQAKYKRRERRAAMLASKAVA